MQEIIYAGRRGMDEGIAPHSHSAWELIYCRQGTVHLTYEGGSLAAGPGMALVIPAHARHTQHTEGADCLFVSLALPGPTGCEPFVLWDDEQHCLLNACDAAVFHFASGAPDRHAFLSAYGQVICCHLAAWRRARKRSPAVEAIERDILAHWADSAFELDASLRALPFNYDYLRKLFQKEMGVTPLQYLNSIRLQKAAEALAGAELTGLTVADAARLCGFREPLYFSRMFKKKYGVAPSFYVSSRNTEQP